MAVEDNIPSAEELALVDPFADPSGESVLGFPEIQEQADNTTIFDHADHGTRLAVNEMHANIDEHFTYKAELDNKEVTSIPEKLNEVSTEDADWEKRLERMAGRRDPDCIEVADSHDYIDEEENVIYDSEDPEHLRYTEVAVPDTAVLDELEGIHTQLQQIGGVSRNEIVALESLLESPGMFGNPRAYSAVYSKAGYSTTMETLGATIKRTIMDIIKRIMDACRDLGKFILKGLSADFMGQHMTVSLITRRQEVLAQARRIDAVYGLQSFKRMTSNSDIPPYKEATSTENFAIRYMDYRTKQRFQTRFTIGMRMIVENSGLSGHVKSLRGEIDRMLQQTEQYIGVLNKNQPDQWSGVDTNINMGGLNSLLYFWNVKAESSPSGAMAEYRSAVNFAFRQEDSNARRPWEFVKVANYTNPFSDNPNFHRTVGSGIDRIGRSLRDLERKVNALSDTTQYNVATGKLLEVQRRLTLVQNMFSMYMSFAKYYESFYQILAQPLMVLGRQMSLFRNKEFVSGMMGNENYAISIESLDGETIVVDKPVENLALACAKQVNEKGFDGLKNILRKCYKDTWLFPGTYEAEDEGDYITYLSNAKLIYRPKVLDLEQETPDWGITTFGKEVGEILFGIVDITKRDPALNHALDCIWDDEHLNAREILRHHGRVGFHRFDDSQIGQITDDKSAIGVLEKYGLVKANTPYHPVHDADEGTWVVTSLGMEVAKHF